ncbi:MAG: TIGR03032 family protein [Nostoc sp. CmiVER01]|uniref:TIGR03032 family protein n=1 Tax=Nostoc sp. CmiVER01 TaxID=3075384 RepID=UPI002AD2819F|nr:TIGR03032 family protein [Nostoc sp. CmiVER01]MDZ8124869.1 TIGR03032 family protein [Nostoc sp. CmiVER01]
MIVQSTAKAALPVEMLTSRHFVDWLQLQQISLAFTTYQSSRLMLLGVNAHGQLSGFERVFDRAMGLYATPERIYLSSKSQLWQLDNVLTPGQLYDGYDKLYIPRIAYTTGDLDIHDLVVEADTERIIFISTILNCLATVSDRHSCIPLWKPKFISRLVNEDRCHLNGLAMVDGKPRYVTLCSQSDVVDGWRDKRQGGGCIIDIQSDEVIATGLSMPHAPRFYQGKLWLLNAGTGEFGYINADGKFQAVTFCPGFLRGLAFSGNYAIVGLSKPRDKTFSGLKLDENLHSKNAEPRCGLMVIDLKTGEVVHWLRLEGEVTELYDVQVLPGVRCPQALGFQTQEIQQLITLDPRSPLLGGNLPFAGDTDNHNIISAIPTENQVWSDSDLWTKQAQRFSVVEQYQQALALQKQLQFTEAIALYEQIIAQYPQYAPAWYQLGVIMDNQGQTHQAVLAYQQALTINPKYAEAYNNLGIVEVAEKNLEKAIAYFESAILSNPNYAFAHNNLGLIWQMQGKLSAAAAKFQEALQKNPDYPEAYLNLGIVLEAQEKLEGAIACYRSAIRHNPDYIKAYIRLGSGLLSLAMTTQGQVDEARVAFEKVLQLQPDSAEAFNYLFYLKEMSCDWRSRQSDLTRIREQTLSEVEKAKPTTISPFDSLYKPWDRNFLLKIAQTYGESIKTQWASEKQSLNFTHSRSLNGRLRIGYLSNDFRNHATSHLMKSLFNLHNQANFEIFAYSFSADNNSEYRQYIATNCEHFQDITNLSIEESARQIYDDGIHILIDLKGYTGGSRSAILALRPAPIQVSYLGYHGTMGADFIDYIISDPVVTPPEFADGFSEKLVTLPHSYQVNDHQQAIASTPVTRSQYGLPESGFVFCCFNHNYKIEPQIFDVWMRILAAVPESVLWLLVRFPAAEDNLRREAEARGIDSDRLIFAQYHTKAEHLAKHQLADLFLDTLYYNAHTTASDALWAGLPVLTCIGTTFSSRVGASLLRAVGLPDLITNNLEQYEQLAIHLGHSPTALQELRQRLAQNRTTYPLFDTSRFTRNLEQAYFAMWEIYAAGNPPKTIEVS